MRIMIVPLVVALIITHYLTTPPEPRSLFTSLLEQNANSNTNHRLLADISAYEVNALNKIGYSSWISNSTYPAFQYLDGSSGESEQMFFYNSSLSVSPIPYANSIFFLFFDPQYIDKKYTILALAINDSFNIENKQWIGTTNITAIYYQKSYEVLDVKHQMTVQFLINETTTILKSEDLIDLKIINHDKIVHPAAPWVLAIPCVIMLIAIQLTKRDNVPAMKVCILSMLLCLNFQLFVSLVELYKGVSNIDNAEGWMLLTGTLTFCVSVRFTQAFEETIRRIMGIQGYLWFYFISFLYLWGLFSQHYMPWFQCLNSLIIVPQIIYNAYYGIKPITSPYFYVMLLVSQLYILYVRGLPHNTVKLSPNYLVCTTIIWLIGMQLMVVFLQHKYGSRFFIPKRFLPNYYNYYVDITNELNSKLLENDCAICLFSLAQEPGQISDPHNPTNLQQRKTKVKIMKTPCNHIFHKQCLENWMEHKFECPVDRLQLPPIQ